MSRFGLLIMRMRLNLMVDVGGEEAKINVAEFTYLEAQMNFL
jgi:hypothetical protein